MPRKKRLATTLLVSTILLMLVYPLASVDALRDKKALLPIADSEVRSEFPDVNHGRIFWLSVEGDGSEQLTYLMFDLGELPADATIEEATLKLYTSGDVGKKAPVSVHYCASNDWTEEGITYNNKPEFQPEPLDTANITSPLTWYSWNVTATAQSAFQNADKRISLVLKAEAKGYVEFISRNTPYKPPGSPETRPQLEILYSYSPQSGVDPVLIGLVAIAVIVAAVVVTGLAYTRRKGKTKTNTTLEKTRNTNMPQIRRTKESSACALLQAPDSGSHIV